MDEKGIKNRGVLIEDGDPRVRLVEVGRAVVVPELMRQTMHEIEPRMLVVGSRGLGAVKRVLLGSVSKYIAEHASCPVCPGVGWRR